MQLKLDMDNIVRRKRAVWFLLSMQKPYKIRVSSGGNGVHVRSDCPGCPRTQDCYTCWLYAIHDDKKRLNLNLSRNKAGLTHNLLWDLKKGKKAGEWQYIESVQDIDLFLRQFTGFY